MGISEQILEMQLLGEYYQLLDIWKCYKIKFILEFLKYIKTEEFSTLLIKDILYYHSTQERFCYILEHNVYMKIEN